MSLTQTDIELSFIRSLACNDVMLAGPQLTLEERRERIRIAIMKFRMHNKPLPIEPTVTYEQAFQLAYNRPCELRHAERDRFGREIAHGASGSSARIEADDDPDDED